MGKLWVAMWFSLSLNEVFYAKVCLLYLVCYILWSMRALPGQGLSWPWADMLSEADEQGGAGEWGRRPLVPTLLSMASVTVGRSLAYSGPQFPLL